MKTYKKVLQEAVNFLERLLMKEKDEDEKRRLMKFSLEARRAIKYSTPIVFTTRPLFQKHPSDAGHDLESMEDVVVEAKGIAPKIHTGVRVAIPEGYFGLVKERSSLAAQGLRVLGGVIDSGYRGEILVNLENSSGYDYSIKAGERIAQLIILPCDAEFHVVNELPPSDRGEKGFGSTGK